MFQYAIIFTVLVVAVGYAAWRIYKTLNRTDDPCCGCDKCLSKEQKQRNKAQCKKK